MISIIESKIAIIKNYPILKRCGVLLYKILKYDRF
nr:MAG TPA: hypothetical protein [Caudoviricetes sp.]